MIANRINGIGHGMNGRSEQAGSAEIVVVDGACNPNLLRAVAAEWPAQNWPHWHRYDDGKLATKDALRIPPAAMEAIKQMLDLRVDTLLKIDDAFPDYNLHGAGMHCHPPGSRLGIHRDAETHPLTGWRRAVSAILYVEPHWNSEWGGELEVWDTPESGPRVKIEPLWNRLVLFRTPGLLHGMPNPVRCPAGRSRKSLAVFFWQEADGTSGCQRADFVN